MFVVGRRPGEQGGDGSEGLSRREILARAVEERLKRQREDAERGDA